MGVTHTARWLNALQALLPPGLAISREPDANVTKLLEGGMAEPLGTAEEALQAQLAQYDPATATTMLADWERLLGLPDCCDAGVAQTLEERRAAVIEKLTVMGGATPQYFIDLMARRGVAITVDELGNHVWRVNSAMRGLAYFRVGTDAARMGRRLRTWGDDSMECRITRFKPAHTRALYGYSSMPGLTAGPITGAPITGAPI